MRFKKILWIIVIIILLIITINSALAFNISDAIAGYTFDDSNTSGATLYDVFGSNDAEIIGATTGGIGVLNEGYYFDGNNDYLNVSDSADFNCFDGLGPWTIAVWVNTTEAGGAEYQHPILERRNAPGDWCAHLKTFTNKAGIYVTDSGVGQCDLQGSSNVNDGTFHHIVATRDTDGHLKLYVDGVFETNMTCNVSVSCTDINTIAVRRKNTGALSEYLEAHLDEMFIWNRALNQTEVTALYNGSCDGGGNPLNYHNFSGCDYVTINVILINPSNNTNYTSTTSSVNIQVQINHSLGNNTNVTFINALDDSVLTTNNNVANGTTTGYSWSVSEGNYSWYVNVSDAEGYKKTSDTWYFRINHKPSLVLYDTNPDISYTTNNLLFNITCTDANGGDTITGYVNTYKDGVLYNSNSSTVTNNTETLLFTLPSANTTKNEVWTGEYYCGDGMENTTKQNNSVTIRNTPPTTPTGLSLNITIKVGEDLTAVGSGSSDNDSDGITYYYRFYNMNDSSVVQAWGTDNTYTVLITDAHDWINITCKAYDGTNYSSGNYSNQTLINNSQPTKPTVTTNPPGSVQENQTFTITCASTDADGDPLINYSKIYNINDSITRQAYSTVMNYTPDNSDVNDTLQVYCKASDGYINSTENYTLIVVTPLTNIGITISINSPEDNTYSVNDLSVSYNYTTYNNSQILNENGNCSLVLNGTINITTYNVPDNSSNNWLNISGMNDGTWLWFISCISDSVNRTNTTQRTYYKDTTNPVIESTLNNTYHTLNYSFYFNVTDFTLKNVSWIDSCGNNFTNTSADSVYVYNNASINIIGCGVGSKQTNLSACDETNNCINKTYSWESRAQLNVSNVTSMVTGSGITNFSIWANGTECCNTTTGICYCRNLSVGLWNITFDNPAYELVSKNLTVNSTTQTYYMNFSVYTYNSYSLIFKNEETDLLINNTNITFELISDVFGNNYSTSNGTLYIDALTPVEYAIRYNGNGYEENFYYATLTNRTHTNITLYLLNSSNADNVTAIVRDTSLDFVEDAEIRILRYMGNGTYTIVSERKTDITGRATLKVTKFEEYYKFYIYYNDDLVFTSEPAYIELDEISFIISTITAPLELFDKRFDMDYDLEYNQNTNNFRLEYSMEENFASQVCLEVWNLNTNTMDNETCLSSASGTILISPIEINGTTYEARAYGYIYGSPPIAILLTATLFRFLESEVFREYGLLMLFIITIVMFFAGAASGHLENGLVLGTIPTILFSAMGWIEMPLAYSAIPLVLVFVLIVFVFNRPGRV